MDAAALLNPRQPTLKHCLQLGHSTLGACGSKEEKSLGRRNTKLCHMRTVCLDKGKEAQAMHIQIFQEPSPERNLQVLVSRAEQ